GNPWLITGAIFLLVVVWMLSGIGSGDDNTAAGEQAEQGESKATDVRVREQRAEEVERFIDVYGRTAPARSVTLKAETGGRVVEVAAERGAYTHKGDVLVRLDVRDRAAQLERARAEVKAAQLTYEAEEALKHESFASETRLAQAQA